MAWRLRNPFKKAQVQIAHDDTPGSAGFGAPLQILYSRRPLPPVDNNGSNAYQTFLSPRFTPIGGGIPNKRDVGTAPPAIALQGVLLSQVGSPGILAGAFVSGPLTNVTTVQSDQSVISSAPANFEIPAA